jgi:hypothetical protein
LIDPVLTYSTYLGGDAAHRIAVDSSGNPYVTGGALSSALGTGTCRVDIKINGQVIGSAIFKLN